MKLINVKDFGAMGEGEDYTSPVQAAVNEASTGGVLFFPPGLYQFNGVKKQPIFTLYPSQPLCIYCIGATFEYNGGGPLFKIVNAIGVTVKGLNVQCNTGPLPMGSQSVLTFDGCRDVFCREITIEGGNGNGISFSAKENSGRIGTSFKLSNSTIRRNNKGVLIYGNVNNCMVTDNVFEECNWGVFADDRSTSEDFDVNYQPHHLLICNNVIRRCGINPSTGGIRLTATKDSFVSNNLVVDTGMLVEEGKASMGILINSSPPTQGTNISERVVVHNNHILDSRMYSIFVANSSNITVMNNVRHTTYSKRDYIRKQSTGNFQEGWVIQ